MARGRRGAEAEADLEPIAPPGWDAVPRVEPRPLTTRARIVIAAALAIALTLGADLYTVHRVTSTRAAESLVEHLAEAQALEQLRTRADQDLRLKAMFPEDLTSYWEAVQALGAEHAERVEAMAREVKGVGSLDGAVRRARTALGGALDDQAASIREEITRNGTIYDTFADEFTEAVEAVQAAGRRWRIGARHVQARPFASIASVLAAWQRLTDVPTGGLRLVLAADGVQVVDVDSGEVRTVTTDRTDSGYLIGNWVLVSMPLYQWRVFDVTTGTWTQLAADWFVPGVDGATAWAVTPTGPSVEIRMPNHPTGVEFSGSLIADTGRHLVASEGEDVLILYDRQTRAPVRRLERSYLIGAGRDALMWTDGGPRLHMMLGGAEQVIELGGSGHAAAVAFSPDGRTAAVSTFSPEEPSRVVLVRSGEAPRQLDGVPDSPFFNINWAENGRWLVLQDSRRVWAVDTDDGSVHRLRVRTSSTSIIGAL